jgi:anaerobic ribonucleoside-triphosphate reductase activating protein
MSKIRLAGFAKESIADGPGFRYTVFAQGCTHNCKNCHNPHTHDVNGGTLYDISEIVSDIKENPLLDGVTFSGGEPFLQAKEFCVLAKEIKKIASQGTSLDIWCYSGFTFEELVKKSYASELLENIDVLVDGRFVEELKSYELKFRGSSNQRFICCKKSLKAGEVVLFEI